MKNDNALKIYLHDAPMFEVSRFNDSEIDFGKSINFVFGRNGTGKSSLCELIKSQCKQNYDTYIFQGFESVLDEDGRLNAIVLGEENVEIDRKIKGHKKRIEEIQSEIGKEEAKISEPSGDETNLYTEKQDLEKKKKAAEIKEENFYTDSARAISKEKDPLLVDNPRNYNKNSFSNEIEAALKQPKLSDSKIKNLKATIKVNQKTNINKVYINEVDLAVLQDEVKELLRKSVQPTEVISEIGNDTRKRQFAEAGIDCHEAGDKCAFCGNVITDERLHKLERYFSSEEIDKFKKELNNKLDKVRNYQKVLSEINIKENQFYPDFSDDISELIKKINNSILKQREFLSHLSNSLSEKQKDLFNSVEYEPKETPPTLAEYIKDYNEIADKNNNYTIELENNKKNAQDKLRYDKIAEIIRSSKLDSIKAEIKTNTSLLDEKNREIEAAKATIEKFNNDKNEIQGEINGLISQTKNTEKLAKNINEKLKIHVNFELERKEDGGLEFYEIKEVIGGEEKTRPVDQLSTGEKNIIAFLYFIESLNDAEKDHTKPKIIAFDDPMNSNDDTMQYLIIDEINKIIKKVSKPRLKDRFILLTHNVSFYLNAARDLKSNDRRKKHKDGSTVDPCKKHNFYRFMTCDGKTSIQKLQKASEDFKNQYESLWHELYFLYSMEKPELMCNPIRRIIESYTDFTQKENFYKDNKDAKILFNANSHAVTDPMTDPLGITHDDVKVMLEHCFRNNGAQDHFSKYWKLAQQAYPKGNQVTEVM